MSAEPVAVARGKALRRSFGASHFSRIVSACGYFSLSGIILL